MAGVENSLFARVNKPTMFDLPEESCLERLLAFFHYF